MKYTIHVDEIGQILSTKQPIEKFKALVSFLKEKLDISINMDFDESSDAESEKLSIGHNSEEYQSTPDSAIDADDTNDTGSEELNSSQDSEDSAPAVEEDIDFSAGILHENYEYGFYGEEREEKHTMILTGGTIFITESNKGNRWLVCVKGTVFSSGAMKEMYPIDWVLSTKDNESIAYKDVPGKYILNLFREDRQRDLPKFLSEKKRITLRDPSTKMLFLIEENQQFGFVMRDYGSHLLTIVTDEQASFSDRLKIAMFYVDEVLALFKQGKTHGDLKPENACYHNAYHAKGEKTTKEKVTLIDLDGMSDINQDLSERPTFTYKYLHPFFKENNNIQFLCLGEYRLIHDLWAMIMTCNVLMFCSMDINNSFFQDDFDEIDKLLVCVLRNPKKLSRDDMLDAVYKYTLKFLDTLIGELNDFFQNLLAINSVENSSPAKKSEERKPDVKMQFLDETEKSSVECVDKLCSNAKEEQVNDESKKRERSLVSSFWQNASPPNKRSKIEHSEYSDLGNLNQGKGASLGVY